LELKKIAVRNISSYGLLQVANYILPLLYVPIIARIIGVERYGIINHIGFIISYFTIFITYGFDYVAIREVSKNIDDDKLLNLTFNNVFNAQLMLFFVSTFVFVGSLFFIDSLKINLELSLFNYLLCISSLLSQNWIFQAKNELYKIAIINFISKLINTGLILAIVTSKERYVYIVLITSLTSILSSAYTFYFNYKKYKLSLKINKIYASYKKIKEATSFFLSNLMLTLYNNFNVIIMGIFCSAFSLGIYTSGQKLISISIMLISFPINMTFYPIISRKIQDNQTEGIKLIKDILPKISLIIFVICLVLFLGADIIIRLFYGEEFIKSREVLKILFIVPLLSFLNNFIGVNILYNLKKEKVYLLITFIASIFGILINTLLLKLYDYKSPAYAWISSELISLTLVLFYLKTKKIIDF